MPGSVIVLSAMRAALFATPLLFLIACATLPRQRDFPLCFSLEPVRDTAVIGPAVMPLLKIRDQHQVQLAEANSPAATMRITGDTAVVAVMTPFWGHTVWIPLAPSAKRGRASSYSDIDVDRAFAIDVTRINCSSTDWSPPREDPIFQPLVPKTSNGL